MSATAPNPVQTARAAYEMAQYGGASSEAISETFVTYYAARIAAESDDQRIIRLERQARSHDACALRFDEQAAEFYGKAAYQRQRGSAAQAVSFQAQADAADRCSVSEMGEAMRLRREASLIKHRIAEATALAKVVSQ